MVGFVPSKKKLVYPINDRLKNYLKKYRHHVDLPIHYEELLRFSVSTSLLDLDGNDTYWETVYYNESDQKDLHKSLTKIYALLKTDGDTDVMEHLSVARIDYCTFGNSKPFRIRIINHFNDNYDHFYVKKADASRVYGLELENVLSPNYLNFLYGEDTLIEEHIAGLPGDEFIKNNLEDTEFNKIRIAKEFVKFNERCFIRLLGDMRSYNYIVDITPDIEGNQYRFRAIDFDQQSYEGKKSFYLPQFFKENNPIIFLGVNYMKPETVKQYQLEERSLVATRAKIAKIRLKKLIEIMQDDRISTPQKIHQLKYEMAEHHKNNKFLMCRSMGDIVKSNLELVLDKAFKQSILSPNQ